MSDVSDQVAQIKANSNRVVQSTVRQVVGGYVVACNAAYNDKVTGATLMALNAEGIATTVEQAATMLVNYVNAGDFNGVSSTPQPAV